MQRLATLGLIGVLGSIGMGGSSLLGQVGETPVADLTELTATAAVTFLLGWKIMRGDSKPWDALKELSHETLETMRDMNREHTEAVDKMRTEITSIRENCAASIAERGTWQDE